MKILIGSPTYKGYAYCLQRYLHNIKRLNYDSFDLVLVDNSEDNTYFEYLKRKGVTVIKDSYVPDVRERIAKSRNILRQYALDNHYDYFFSLEQDVLPPEDVLERLLSHKKQIVSGVYYKLYPVTLPQKEGEIHKNVKAIVPVIFTFSDEKDKMRVCTVDQVKEPKLMRIRAAGLGCMLIHKDVLKKVSFRHKLGSKSFDDFLFASDIHDKGFEMYADTSVKCKHLILKKNDKMFEP